MVSYALLGRFLPRLGLPGFRAAPFFFAPCFALTLTPHYVLEHKTKMGVGMSCILRIQETNAEAVDTVTAVAILAKGYPWTARVVADVPVFVLVADGIDATDEDLYINEFEECPLLAVGADQDVSVLGTDVGTVWVSEVRISS